ncbi:MAG: hypothetical protein AB8B59_01435, partial [Maribacter sp.]
FSTLLFVCSMSFAQFETNYDESKVPEFSIPDPLITFAGEKITTSEDWMEKRRPELFDFFENKVYGKVPGNLDSVSFKLLEESENAINGKATRKQVEVTLIKNKRSIRFTILIYLPKNSSPSPIFLGYNFYGNHTITTDPNVIISDAWAMNSEAMHVSEHRLTEASRGLRAHRWAIEKIIDNGFGLATIYNGEIDPDKNDLLDGLQSLFYDEGQEKPEYNEWGSLAVWAFGYSRALDYFEQDIEIDANKVVVFGHSRLGKAALWAGATDQRFAGVISNNSGCGGAALSKRKFGEIINVINSSFPHWFSFNFKNYNNNEEALTVDQHQLLALIAPTPLYVASAQDDLWADPKGEFLSAHYASSVYSLFDKEGLITNQIPEVHSPIHKTVAYHIREGKHDVTNYDWEQYIKWAGDFLKLN